MPTLLTSTGTQNFMGSLVSWQPMNKTLLEKKPKKQRSSKMKLTALNRQRRKFHSITGCSITWVKAATKSKLLTPLTDKQIKNKANNKIIKLTVKVMETCQQHLNGQMEKHHLHLPNQVLASQDQ